MGPDELCMTSAEVSELARFAAVTYTWAVSAWYACAAPESELDPGVRVLP